MVRAAESNPIEMATYSTFSYAQAAKGHGAAPSVTPASNPPTQVRASQQVSAASKTTLLAENAADLLVLPINANASSTSVEKHHMGSTNGSETESRPETTTDGRLEAKRDDAGHLERPWRRTDEGMTSSSATAQSVDESDSRKPRKNKKARASDKLAVDQTSISDTEPAPAPEASKVELSEAPIPSVNVWQQRREAQAARIKPAIRRDGSTNGVPDQADDAKKTIKTTQDSAFPAREGASTNGAKPVRKTSDISCTERNGSRGSRSIESDIKDDRAHVPPSVQDAASWPTPETAIKEDRRKSTSAQVERQEKESSKEGQDDASSAKPRQKGKWVAYDYVPTVNFETQLPQMRSSKPRGGARGANGTRTSTGAFTGDKVASAAPASRVAEPKERPREVGAASSRTASLPPTGKRDSTDAFTAKDQKKVTGYAGGDRTKDATAPLPTVRTMASLGGIVMTLRIMRTAQALYPGVVKTVFWG